MIIEYNSKYSEDVKELLYELQEYIMSIDKEKYNTISQEYKEEYFNKVMEEVKEYQGKIMLYEEDNKIVGLIIGCINNEETNDFDFKAPRRGRITEFIIKKEYRSKNIGQELFKDMEEYLYGLGCKDIIIGVFAYNDLARKFYEKNGYHLRMIEMIKKGQ